MTNPEEGEPQRPDEPEHLEADGFLNRALRLLGEGLGPYVASKTGDKTLQGSRDVYKILQAMESKWDECFRPLGRSARSYLVILREIRNLTAHQGKYSDHDVLHYLNVIERLSRTVAANDQAQAVGRMWNDLVKLIIRDTQPTPHREASEFVEPRQLTEFLHRFATLLEGGRFSPDPTPPFPIYTARAAQPAVPSPDYGAPFDTAPVAPDSAEDFLRQGNEARSEGHIEEALTCYKQAIALNPSLAEAYVALGNAYVDGEEYEQAITEYDQALRLSPDDAAVHFYCGSAYAAIGDDERALSDYGDALRFNPPDSLATAVYGNRGNVYRKQSEYDLAIGDYDAALMLNPNDEVSAALHFNRGHASQDKGEHDQAIADFSEALQLDPDIAEAYEARGFAYFITGQHDLAIEDFDSALKIDSDNGLARMLRGHAYFNRGEYDLSIADCSVAIELDPDFAIAFVVRGLALDFKDEHDRAIADYEAALALEPDDDVAQLARENMRLSQGSKDRAARLLEYAPYEQSIADNPQDPQNWHLTGLYFLDNRGDYRQAIEYFDIALAIAPDNAEVWNDRGWARSKQGEDDQAYDDYGRAIELKPDFANAFYNRAWVWRRRAEHRNAIIDFSQAITIDPDYAAAYQHRGISYFDIGDRDKAQDDFEMARSLGFNP